MKYLQGLFMRIAITLLLPLNSLALFYAIFTPLTISGSYFLLSLLYEVSIKGNLIFVNSHVIEIIKACVAGSAYYLLAILNLLTKGVSLQKRIKAFLFGAVLLLAVNVIRIFALTVVLVKYGTFTFNSLHLSFWILGSTIFVAAIWIATIRLFNIEEIPIYSDAKEVLKIVRKSKVRKSRQ